MSEAEEELQVPPRPPPVGQSEGFDDLCGIEKKRPTAVKRDIIKRVRGACINDACDEVG